MYKNLINKHLGKIAVNEETHPKIKNTNSVQKSEEKINKEYYKEVEKKMATKDNIDDEIEIPKTNVEGDTKEYHDEMEIRNGEEMLKYDNEPSDKFKDRAEMALRGDSKMGNDVKTGEWDPETGDGNGNTEEVWGSSGGKNTGEEIIKSAKKSNKKRDDAEYNLIQFGDDIEKSDETNTIGKNRKIAVENKLINKKDMKKRLKFKKSFDGLGNALKLIPENYKVDNKEFQMTDGNETYDIRWEGDMKNGKPIVLSASDKNMVNEDIQKIKHLMSFNSKDTLGSLTPKDRIVETNDKFKEMLNKTKKLIKENKDENNTTEE